MRRASCGLGSLAGNTGLLALIGLLFCAAASATATSGPALFRLTISGTATASWDHTTAPVTAGGCETSVRSEGLRTARFRSSRATLVRVVAGRALTVEARGVAGTVRLSGPNTLNRVCGPTGTHTPQPCDVTTRTFSDARTMLLSTKKGSISLRPLRLRLRRIECPQEPDEAVAAPLGPVPGPKRISVAALLNSRITHFTVRVSASRHTAYGPREAGVLDQRSAWTLTFQRIRP